MRVFGYVVFLIIYVIKDTFCMYQYNAVLIIWTPLVTYHLFSHVQNTDLIWIYRVCLIHKLGSM